MTFHADDFGPLKDASLTFALEPVDGKTKLSKWARGRTWGVWGVVLPLLRWRIQKEDEIGNIKRILESRA